MKISEVMSELQSIKDEYGDLPVQGTHREYYIDNVWDVTCIRDSWTESNGETVYKNIVLICV